MKKGLFSLFTKKLLFFLFVCSLSTTYDICIYVFDYLKRSIMMLNDDGKISSLSLSTCQIRLVFFVLFYSIVLSIVCHSTTTTTTIIMFLKRKNIEKKTIENANNNNNNNNKFYIYVYVYMCLFCVFGRRMCFFCSLEYGHNDDKI